MESLGEIKKFDIEFLHEEARQRTLELFSKDFSLKSLKNEKLYSNEQIECAKEVIASYTVSEIEVPSKGIRSKKIPYEIAGASIWLTGIFMGKPYYKSIHFIAEEVMKKKLGVPLFPNTVKGLAYKMIKNPDVKKTILKIHEKYGKPKISKKLKKILEYLKGS